MRRFANDIPSTSQRERRSPASHRARRRSGAFKRDARRRSRQKDATPAADCQNCCRRCVSHVARIARHRWRNRGGTLSPWRTDYRAPLCPKSIFKARPASSLSPSSFVSPTPVAHGETPCCFARRRHKGAAVYPSRPESTETRCDGNSAETRRRCSRENDAQFLASAFCSAERLETAKRTTTRVVSRTARRSGAFGTRAETYRAPHSQPEYDPLLAFRDARTLTGEGKREREKKKKDDSQRKDSPTGTTVEAHSHAREDRH